MEHFDLGVKYLQGDGIDSDLGKAAQHFRDAAAEGNPRAKFNLGLMYLKGSGVEYDCDEALKWLREAAHAGHPGARQALSQYFSQFDARSDSPHTLHNLHVSIEEDDPPAHHGAGIDTPSLHILENVTAEAPCGTAQQPINSSHTLFIKLVGIILASVALMEAISWLHQGSPSA